MVRSGPPRGMWAAVGVGAVELLAQAAARTTASVSRIAIPKARLPLSILTYLQDISRDCPNQTAGVERPRHPWHCQSYGHIGMQSITISCPLDYLLAWRVSYHRSVKPLSNGPMSDCLGLSELPFSTKAMVVSVPNTVNCPIKLTRTTVALLLSTENVRVSCRATWSVEPCFPGKEGERSGCCNPFPIPWPPAGRRVHRHGNAVPHG